MDWRNLMKQSVTVGAQLLWGGCYGCNNGRYGCTIVMSYIEINKAVSQWLLTFNLCVSVTWPLTCAFHIPCTHTPEIIDMHRGVCDNTCSGVAPGMFYNINQPQNHRHANESKLGKRVILRKTKEQTNTHKKGVESVVLGINMVDHTISSP